MRKAPSDDKKMLRLASVSIVGKDWTSKQSCLGKDTASG